MDATGNRVTGSVTMTLAEYQTRADIILSGLSTMSIDWPLVSGGSFNLKITQNGQELRIDEQENVQAYFPRVTETDGYEEEMVQYSGEVITVPIGPTLTRPAFSWTQVSELPLAVNATDFVMDNIGVGYTNCDALFHLLSFDRTTFGVQIPDVDWTEARVYYLLEGLRTMRLSR